jgi:cytochrome P450
VAQPDAAINVFAPELRADPYPAYAELRAEAPVCETPWGGWLVSRYADCASLLKDPRASSDPAHSNAYRDALQRGLIDRDEALGRTPPFLITDPPDHTRLRGLVSKAFTPRVIEGLRPRVQEIVDELLDSAKERGETELVEEIAYPLPVRVVCELLGVPAEDHGTFKEWSRLLARSMDPQPLLPPEVIEGRRRAGNAFTEYFRDLIAERRRSPRPDLISSLIEAEEAGDKLSADELLSTCILLLGAGHETTASLIGNGVLALARHADEWRRLHADPSLARSAVEEFLRYDAPVHFAFRTAKEEIELRGKSIPRGSQLLLLLASANRDEERFARPDRLDIARDDNHHLSFGAGRHFCLGAPLARLEGEVFFGSLAQRFAAIELTVDARAYKPNIVNRGLASLPVRLRRTAA